MTQPQYGWEVRFAHRNISHIVISEYEMDSWVEGQRRLGMKKQFLVLRFKCARITASRDVSVLPMDDEEELDRLYHEMDTDRPVIEEVAAVDDMDRPAREYPLAKLCGGPDSLAGKEIRLAFLKGSSHHRNKYLWAWPALVNFLAGQTYKHVKGDNKNKMPLDEWARENKDRLPAAKLTEVGILGGSEWIVERKG